MSRDAIDLKPGALLVADAHYSEQRPELLDFLKAVASERIPATQLILMGDVFDLLFGPIPLTHERNAEAIDVVRQIALRIDVIYLEGNHDFQLASLFPDIQVFPLQQQPVPAHFEDKQVLLAHGDWGTELGYRLYTSVIRSRPVLNLLRNIDGITGHSIIKWLDRYLLPKEDCSEFTGFESYITARLDRIDLEGIDYFIEGHYHQNKAFDVGRCHYINLGAFACNQRYFEVKSTPGQKPLKEVFFGKET